jgi:hypothetical protein
MKSVNGKWFSSDEGAALGPDGCVYGVPASARHVLKIDPTNDKVSCLSVELGKNENKWGQGVLAPDGIIYCAPCNADAVLCIDAANGGSAFTHTSGSLDDDFGTKSHNYDGTRHKWWGAVYVPDTDGQVGSIYFTPQSATVFIKYDHQMKKGIIAGEVIHTGGEKYMGACVSNGNIVVCPANRTSRQV